MIGTQPSRGSEQARAVLRARCEELGLVVWRIDQGGRVIDRPALTGGAEDWFGSALIARSVNAATSTWNGVEHPVPFEAFRGCWLIPVPEVHRRRRCGYSVAVALGTPALDSEQFVVGCDSAQIDLQATRAALRPHAIWTQSTVERFATVLDWSRDDLRTIAQHEATLAGFSSQLSDSFEEISLLYTLGRSMNELEQPQNYVRQACDELHASLGFQWIAVQFIRDEPRARGMSGRLFYSGELPCEATEFARQTVGLVGQTDKEGSRVLSAEALGPIGASCEQVLEHPIVRDGAVVGALLAGGKVGGDSQVSSFDRKLLDATTGYLSILLDNAFLYDDQQLMFVGTLEALTASIDAKDPYTSGHSERVAHLAAALGRAFGLDEDEVERVQIAGLVHDIGKIGVPESVLCKTGRLTRAEYDRMKEHPAIGHRILKDIPMMGDLLPAVLHHHERIDGHGYPQGLHGDQIPLFARIVCVVDSFDAMSSTRTYRDAMSRPEVFAELRANAGSQFDSALVDAFMTVDLERYDELVERNQAQAPNHRLRLPSEGTAA